ncbi:MAG: hypothetical protein ABJC07_12765 [Acidobacteriota bacterium]
MNSNRGLRIFFPAAASLLFFAAILIGPAAAGVLAEDRAENSATPLEGRWLLDFDRDDGRLQLSMERRAGSHNSQSSSSYRLEDFRDLRRPAGREDVPARFALVRDAGTFSFEGHLDARGGAGRFQFSASPDFARAWNAAARKQLSAEQLCSMALHDVSLVFLKDLRSLGYTDPSANKVIAMRIHGVTADEIRELQSLGYGKLSTDTLVSFRIHGVTPQMVRELSSQGYERIPPDQLVSMRIHGVTPEYVRAFASLGYRDVSPDSLVSMRIHGVNPEYVRDLSELGYRNVSVDDLVSMRIHGVTIDDIRKVQARERNVFVDELVSRRIHSRSE